ncbi:MAG: aminotransferase class I/II-fold pyridoxal phosphate-dependent enzyme [Hyphomicrobium sp.]|nr:aminotransferase class I/II-fold pyridoxal phosphate-dependent enzyme [Hyphomicrobium sp.]
MRALNEGQILSPFTRLRHLLDGRAPGRQPAIELTIGEPREKWPDFILDVMREAAGELGRYPPIKGTDELRLAIAQWLERRFALTVPVDPAREVLALNGSREGLFYACFTAMGRKTPNSRPAILMCNPYYSSYIAGALAAGAEPVFLNATADSGFLPDLDRLSDEPELLERSVALFIGSPSNPHGAVAQRAYLSRALALARTHDIMLFLDECYSEIYTDTAPAGGLAVAAATPERFRNLVVFNSLSKRSNLPGLRSGFAAGDAEFLAAYSEFRNMCAPQVPGLIQHASAAAWRDETHVEAARVAYREKFQIADAVLGGRFGYRRPEGGFCLWLDMADLGGGENAAVTLWKALGVKVIPGAYLAQPDRRGVNPGDAYVRVALVKEPAVIREALERIVEL